MEKANISINVLIWAILGLVVLVVLLMVFNDQIRNAAMAYFKIGEDARDGAQGKKCITLISTASRKCALQCDEGWNEISPSGEKWDDCNREDDKMKCCEKS